VKSIPHLLAFVALIALYQVVGTKWGRSAKLYFLVGMLALYVIAALVLFVMRRRLCGEHAQSAEGPVSSSAIPWYWRIFDTMIGVSFVIGPPVGVTLVRQQPLSWDGEFTGYHLLAMAGGAAAYFLGRTCVIRKWQQRHRISNDAA
jgi:hypothetical protein